MHEREERDIEPPQMTSRESESGVRFPLPNEYIRRLEERGYQNHINVYRTVVELAKAFKGVGGMALLVGGSVRDVVFGNLAKDFDLEIYRLTPAQVEEITKRFGKVSDVGRAFGILKLTVAKGVDIDISLPRTDSKVSEGHRGFEVKVDPNMSVAEAALRRDFTINSMAADPLTGEIYDPWGGTKDIQERRLRVTSEERFPDDPLRVLRALQLVARFGLELDPDSAELMRRMAPTLKELPKERILEEWKKLLTKSEQPSLGLRAGRKLGVFAELYPELLTIGQWEQMLSEVDAVADLVRERELEEGQTLTLTLTTLGSYLVHEKGDVAVAHSFLHQLGVDNLTRDKVLKLISEQERSWRDGSVSDGEIRRLARRLHPATIAELASLAEARQTGPAGAWLLKRARELAVAESPPAGLTQGRDWLAFGFEPGPHLGRLIRLSNDLRDDKAWSREQVFQAVDGITDPAEAIARLELSLRPS